MIKVLNNVFSLETKDCQYVIGVDDLGYNRFLHFGNKCPIEDFSMEPIYDENSNISMLDAYKQELTVFGGTMYRNCGIKATFFDGCRDIDLEYDDYELDNLNLKLFFKDRYYDLKIILNYEIYEDSNIITKWYSVENSGKEDIAFEKLMSGEMTLPSHHPYYIENTNGAWSGEFLRAGSILETGKLVFESRRGSSSHNQRPSFMAYTNADEHIGALYYGTLAYSGNFKVECERDLFGITRIIMGISDLDFRYLLKPGEIFETPKILFGYAQGLGEMSREMNRFAINHVLPVSFNDQVLPVLYNSWEATYFDVSVEQQKELAKRASDIGIELFVLDDGWFGNRKSDDAGLGDWFVDQEKFPNGLDELIDYVNELGMDFGIWMEPEMVNKDSVLFRAHPDWIYYYEHRTSHELRQQLVLNMTLKEVQDYLFECIDVLVSQHNIKYIKWDMNRAYSEMNAYNLECPQMVWYLHIKAVYDLVDKLKEKHPQLMIESCASGGGRSDYGALYHFDQVWTSDNTDAIDRMSIQRGYSLMNPIKTMRAWVCDITGVYKPSSLDFRFNIAMQGSLGLGGDLSHYSEEELEICRRNIALYKDIRKIIQLGDLYRIMDSDQDEILINHYVSKDQTKSVCFIASRGTRFYKKKVPLLFEGLNSSKIYSFDFNDHHYQKSGAYLMNIGIDLEVRGAYYNKIMILTSTD